MRLRLHLHLLLSLLPLVHGDDGDDAKAFVGSLAECASIDLDLDACVATQTIDTLVSLTGETQQSSSNSNSSSCKPDIDASTIEYAVSEAAHSCATVNEGEIYATTQAFSTLFGDDSEVVEQCWAATCSMDLDNNGNGGGDDGDGNGDDDWMIPEFDVIGAVLDEAMQCPGVTIDPESCLVSTALQGLNEVMGFGFGSDEDEGGDESGGRHRRRLIHSVPGLCTPPEIDEDEVRLTLEFAATSCSQAGIAVEPQEIDTTVDSVIHAFSSSCFDSICHRMMAETLALSFDSAASCAGIAPFADDCLTQGTLKTFADEGADFRFPEFTLELCHFGELELETLAAKITEVGDVCLAEDGMESTLDDIEQLASDLAALFDASTCWDSYCVSDTYTDDNNDDDDNYDDNGDDVSAEFFTKLVVEHMFECAGVPATTSSAPSCLDTTLEGFLFNNGGGGGGGGGEFTSASSSAAAANVNAAQSSMVPIRRHLQQIPQFTSVNGGPEATANEQDNDTTAYGEFGNEEYPDQDEFDNDCIVPEVDTESMDFLVAVAKGTCENEGHIVTDSEVMAVTNKYTALFTASHCWEELCHDEFYIKLIGDYFKDCAGIDLPLAATSSTENPSPDDAIIGCMIDYVMSTPHSEFGLPAQHDPLDQCYPPGHQDVAGTCPVTIAPLALKHCTDNRDMPPSDDFFGSMSYEYGDLDWGWGEDLFFEDQFFFSMSMSMSYGYGDSDDVDKPPPPPPVDLDRDARLMEEFCKIVEQLSSDEGKQCLLPLCGDVGDGTGGDDNTLATTAPSIESSSAPSSNPSGQPSTSPTTVPSVSPTLVFTTSPSSAPSTSTETNGVVEIRYEASITVENINISSIPTTPGEDLDKLIDVLTTSIGQFLPENTEVQIIRIGGIPIAGATATSDGRLRRYRLLQADAGVEIEFEVISTLDCDDAECSDAETMSSEAYETMTQDMAQAVDSGELTTALQEEAAAADVVALASIRSFEFKADQPTVTITEGSDDDSAAAAQFGVSVSGIIGIVALVLCIV